MRNLVLFALLFLTPLSQSAASLPLCKDIEGFRSGISIMPLNLISEGLVQKAALNIMGIANDLYLSAEAKGNESIFPIDGRMMNGIYNADARTGISQVAFNANGDVVGFALAYYDPTARVISLEKFGVTEDVQGQGVGRKLMHALAQVAAGYRVMEIQLLVRKGNKSAMGIYEHWGFVNVTPPAAMNHPQANAFAYSVLTDTLLRKTAP